MSGEAVKAVASTGLRERLVTQGNEPRTGGSAEFAKYLRAELAKSTRVIKDAEIPAQ